MKKSIATTILFTIILLLTPMTFAEDLVIDQNGNVGIGVPAPNKKLHIKGELKIEAENDSNSLKIIGNENHTILSKESARIIGPGSRSVTMEINGNDATDRFSILTDPSNGSSANTEAFVVNNNGNIGIGTSDPGDCHVRIQNMALNDDSGFRGLYVYENKTTGSSNYENSYYGIHNYLRLNQANGETGYLYGIYNRTLLVNGTIGNASSGARSLYGGYFTGETDSGTVTGSVISTRAFANIDGGTVLGSVFGLDVFADVESAASIGGDVYGGYIQIDCDSDPVGKAYGLYLTTASNVDYGIYVNGSAANYFGGNIGIGTTTPTQKLDVNGNIVSTGLTVNGSSYFNSGNVGIAKTNPTEKLDVNGNIKCNNLIGNVTVKSVSGDPVSFSIVYDSENMPYVQTSTGGVAKTFVIDHPTDDSKYLVHATLEGPEAGVYYRGTAQLENGETEIELPHYFEALTREEGRTIMLTNIDGFDRLMVKRIDGQKIKDGRFLVVADNAQSSQEFDWEVKAIRKDVPHLDVEPDKDGLIVRGNGPYTYAIPKTGARD